MKITDLISTLNNEFHGGSPFENVQLDPAKETEEIDGWFGEHALFDQVIANIATHFSIEVGVWQGKSAIYTAQKMAEKTDDFGIICVDTWLGSIEHRVTPRWREQLRLENGYPRIYEKFLNNIVANGFEKHIFPLPLPSNQAAIYLKAKGIQVAMLYIDAGHDYQSVKTDLESFWPLLGPSGILIGDDYDATNWPGVIQATNEFFSDKPETVQVNGGNYAVQKRASK